MRASEIAATVGGELEGTDPEITTVAPIDRAGPDDLSFLADARYAPYVSRSSAGVILVSTALADHVAGVASRIVVHDAHQALAMAIAQLYPERPAEEGVHETALIGRAEIPDGVSIGACAVIGDEVELGRGTRVGAHTFIGNTCRIGENVTIHSHVTLYEGVRLGSRSVIHSGARLGVDGFGYVEADGSPQKIPQVGGCIVGTDVEIGANTTIDRGSIGDTEIGDGVKIDNLVQIGHNVRVGDGAVIVAQVGIAGSTKVGRGVTLGGQAGVSGHLQVGDGATIAGQSGVFGDVPAGAVYSGYPARPHKEALRAQAGLFRLTRLKERVRALEKALLRNEDSTTSDRNG